MSAAYGFLCGAYMPISSLADGVSHALAFLPGTYGTSLLHEHFMGGATAAEGIRSGFDCTLSFFGRAVPEWACFLIIGISALVLVGVYVLCCTVKRKRKKSTGRP